jgi:hypothetical protein
MKKPGKPDYSRIQPGGSLQSRKPGILVRVFTDSGIEGAAS